MAQARHDRAGDRLMNHPVTDTLPSAYALAVSVASAASAVAVDPVVQWAGVPLEVVLWAFAGAACALSFLPELSRGRAVVALTVGTVLAIACTPLVVLAAELPEVKYDKGVAAVLGLGMQVVVSAAFGSAPKAVADLIDALVARVRGK